METIVEEFTRVWKKSVTIFFIELNVHLLSGVTVRFACW